MSNYSVVICSPEYVSIKETESLLDWNERFSEVSEGKTVRSTTESEWTAADEALDSREACAGGPLYSYSK